MREHASLFRWSRLSVLQVPASRFVNVWIRHTRTRTHTPIVLLIVHWPHSGLTLHSSYMTCDNNNKPTNKQISISRTESGAIVGTNFIPAKCAGFPLLMNDSHSEHEHK